MDLLPHNVALDGTATQVSTYTQGGVPQEAFYANDGNFSTDLPKGARCAITGAAFGAWWQVDLQDLYYVSNVSITTRHNSGVFQNIITFPFHNKIIAITFAIRGTPGACPLWCQDLFNLMEFFFENVQDAWYPEWFVNSFIMVIYANIFQSDWTKK